MINLQNLLVKLNSNHTLVTNYFFDLRAWNPLSRSALLGLVNPSCEESMDLVQQSFCIIHYLTVKSKLKIACKRFLAHFTQN